MKVANKNIIVTGAGNGIGKELVRILLMKGATVAALDISEESLNNLKEEFKGSKLETFAVDVSSFDNLAKFKEDYYKKFKVVDGLINNAGIIQPFVPVSLLEDKVIDRVMNVNFFGPINLVRLFIDDLLARPVGHIVNVASMAGFFPFPKQTIYGASKSALKLFTEGLYAELLETGVRVTIVFPGAIATDITKNSGVEMKKTNTESSSYKMLSAEGAASEIIEGMEKDAFQLYVGSDAKFMNKFYKLSPKKAIKFVAKKMGDQV